MISAFWQKPQAGETGSLFRRDKIMKMEMSVGDRSRTLKIARMEGEAINVSN